MPHLRIAGGMVLAPGRLISGDVVVAGERILADPAEPVVAAGAERVLDASGLLVAPGLIDVQCNGAHGIDVATEPERIWELAASLPRYGVTAFLPTVITSPPDVVERALATWRAGPPPGWLGSVPLGLHIEGPMLNPVRRGAHAAALLRAPDPSLVESWARDAGVRLVTLAPELPGALDVVRRLTDTGVVVSAGHTDATAAELTAGIDAGITYVTHLFNAMSPLGHRAPGAVGAALADERVVVGLIADGIHVHPTAVTVAWRALGSPRLNLVTDAVAALGLGPGPARLGMLDVTVGPDGVRAADGTLAGAVISLDRAARNLVAFTGCTAAEAVTTVTSTPARLLGLSDRGAIVAGARADLTLVAPDLTVVATIIGGDIVHESGAVRWRS
jgi:N-acetylglucosamine-6-phosphate deacetylase